MAFQELITELSKGADTENPTDAFMSNYSSHTDASRIRISLGTAWKERTGLWKYEHTEFPICSLQNLKSHKAKRLVDGAQHLCYWALVEIGLCNLTRKKKKKRERSFDMLRLEHCEGNTLVLTREGSAKPEVWDPNCMSVQHRVIQTGGLATLGIRSKSHTVALNQL